MCSREGMSLQRGMYFREPPNHGIILMSRRPNAPYVVAMTSDESVLFMKDTTSNKTVQCPNPKVLDQPWTSTNGKPNENGKFANWVDSYRRGRVEVAIFRVYKKMRSGIWTDRGLFYLKNCAYPPDNGRKVVKFRLEQADFDDSISAGSFSNDLQQSRQNQPQQYDLSIIALGHPHPH